MDKKRFKPSGAQFRKRRKEKEEKRTQDKGIIEFDNMHVMK